MFILRSLLILNLCTAFLLCTTDTNPYTEYKNAQICIIDRSFEDLDTIEIFSRESLIIAVKVPDLIDSIVIKTPSNEEFEHGKWCIPSAAISVSGGNHPVYFTFFDTGMQAIELLTYRSNGDEVRMNLKCYLKSPLEQKTIVVNLGDTVKLSTNPVKKDVIYEWNIGGNIYKSTSCCTSVVVRDAENNGIGLLRVLDNSISSPAVEFSFKFTDLQAPEIALMPITYTVKGDTIKTSEKNFYFTVAIKDKGGDRIDSASINGERFDKIQNNIYTKIFHGIDTLAQPLILSLYATDNYIYRNVATARYYLQYDSKVSNNAGIRIYLLSPSGDSSRVSTRNKDIFVKLDSYTELYKDVKVVIESITRDTVVEHDSNWIGTASLKPGPNMVRIKAISGEKVLDSICRVIIFDTTGSDTVKPVILEIRADGEIIKNEKYEIPDSIVKISIIAFDEASGIDTLLINGRVQTIDSEKYLWTFKDTIRHHTDGDTFQIKVVDKKNNSSKRKFVLFYNRKPRVLKWPKPPRLLVVGDTYRDTINVRDDDHDFLNLSIRNSKKMTINSEGIIQYTADLLEKGVRNFSIEADDGYGKSLIFTFDILVMEKNQVPKPVRFISTEKSLPEVVLYGNNVVCPLVIDSSTGKQPFSIKAIRLHNRREFPVSDQNCSVTLCCFDSSDLGELPCMIIVQDSLLTADTIYPIIKIVQEDKNELKMIGTPKYYQDGVIDLRQPVELMFRIIDPHWKEGKKCLAYVQQKGVVSSGPINVYNDTFSLAINSPDSISGYDTVIVRVNDAATEVCCTLSVFYGVIMDQIAQYLPQDSAEINDSIVAFSWQSSKYPNLSWELYYGLFPVMNKKIITDTGFCKHKITQSGLYGWKVVAYDSRNRIESNTKIFKLTNPSHVRFDSTAIKIKTEYEARVDTIKINLPVKNRIVPDSAYRCWFGSDRQRYLPVINGKLIFLPQDKDSGWQQLIATVTDEAGNSDTLKQMIHIFIGKHLQCTAVPVAGRITTRIGNYEEFNLSHVCSSDTFVFNTGRVPDSVKIGFSHSECVVKNTASDKITVIINPEKAVCSRDTMNVYLKAGSDIQTYKYLFYYGTAPTVDSSNSPEPGSFKALQLDTLKWYFTDIDNDSLKYDLYFGNNPDPILIASGLRNNSYIFNSPVGPGIYYWKVVAHDGRFSSETRVWVVYVNTYIIKINTFGTGLNGNLCDIPLLVRLDKKMVDFPVSQKTANFRKGKNLSDTLPFEIDFWENTDSVAIWVLMDTIKAQDSAQSITMQIGGNTGSSSNGYIVFDTAKGFEGVWHLQNYDDFKDEFLDATINNISGDDNSDGDADGFIGRGQGFEGVSYLPVDNIELLDGYCKLGSNDSIISFETWVNFSKFSGDGVILSLSNDAIGNDSRFKVSVSGTGYVRLATRPELAIKKELRSSEYIGDGKWHYLYCSADFSSDELTIYIDGVKDTSVIFAGINNNNIGLCAPRIAILGSDVGTNNFIGHIDEPRILHKKINADWIRFCYENQRLNSTVVKVVRP